MTDQRREQRTYPPRSAYMQYTYTTEMARRHERQRQIAQLDDEIRRDEAMMMKRMHDSRMKTEKAIREIRLEQERRLIKEEQKRHEHEERRRIHRQNREQLERELQRIKNELRAELAKEEMKCQKADKGKERVQHKEKERKRLRVTQEKEVCLNLIKGRQPAVELKAQEQKQRIKDKQSTATGQENERIQDGIEEGEQRKDTDKENENEACMVNDETHDEESETEVQTGYRKKTHEDSMISDDTPQQDCTCSCISYDPLNISCAHITTLEVLQNSDHQETPVDETHEVCIAQESLSDDPIQSDSAYASLSDEKLQNSEENIEVTVQKVHHDTDLQKKVMQQKLLLCIAQECVSDTQVPQSLLQLDMLLGDSEVREIMYAESRDIVLTCTSKNSCLCFKFLWWQEGTLSS